MCVSFCIGVYQTKYSIHHVLYIYIWSYYSLVLYIVGQVQSLVEIHTYVEFIYTCIFLKLLESSIQIYLYINTHPHRGVTPIPYITRGLNGCVKLISDPPVVLIIRLCSLYRDHSVD